MIKKREGMEPMLKLEEGVRGFFALYYVVSLYIFNFWLDTIII